MVYPGVTKGLGSHQGCPLREVRGQRPCQTILCPSFRGPSPRTPLEGWFTNSCPIVFLLGNKILKSF